MSFSRKQDLFRMCRVSSSGCALTRERSNQQRLPAVVTWRGSQLFICTTSFRSSLRINSSFGCKQQKLEETKATVGSMRQLLETKHARLAATLDGAFPQLKHSVWHSESSQQSAVQTLTPQMTENKAKVRLQAASLCIAWLRRRCSDAACDGQPGCSAVQLPEEEGSNLETGKRCLQVEDLLRETMVMQEALQKDASAGLLEKLLPKRHKQYQRGISSRA